MKVAFIYVTGALLGAVASAFGYGWVKEGRFQVKGVIINLVGCFIIVKIASMLFK